jgi:hypothetical protein
MNKTFDEPDDDVHPSSAGGCWRCGTAQKKKRTRAGTRRWNKKKGERERCRMERRRRRRRKRRWRTGSRGGDGGRGKPARKKLGVIYNNRKRKRRRSRLDS